jgi:hypothetical protein
VVHEGTRLEAGVYVEYHFPEVIGVERFVGDHFFGERAQVVGLVDEVHLGVVELVELSELFLEAQLADLFVEVDFSRLLHSEGFVRLGLLDLAEDAEVLEDAEVANNSHFNNKSKMGNRVPRVPELPLQVQTTELPLPQAPPPHHPDNELACFTVEDLEFGIVHNFKGILRFEAGEYTEDLDVSRTLTNDYSRISPHDELDSKPLLTFIESPQLHLQVEIVPPPKPPEPPNEVTP